MQIKLPFKTTNANLNKNKSGKKKTFQTQRNIQYFEFFPIMKPYRIPIFKQSLKVQSFFELTAITRKELPMDNKHS